MIAWASRLVAAVALVVLTSCGPDEPSVIEEQDAALNLSPEVNQQLAQLRRLVAPFHDLDAAQAAGWSVQFTDCLDNPGVGAMGYHFANETFLDDAEAVLLEPELLVYEPQKNGKYRLVAVEYIIPFSELSQTADPPVLLGQEFHQNLDANIWALHVWIGRNNPDGIFADWNPKVSCEYAD